MEKFKAYLEDFLSECKPPSEVELREHVLAQILLKVQTQIQKRGMEVRAAVLGVSNDSPLAWSSFRGKKYSKKNSKLTIPPN